MAKKTLVICLISLFLLGQQASSKDAGNRTSTGLKSSVKIDSITAELIQEHIASYNFAKEMNERVKMCVEAGLIAQYYSQARDAKYFKEWREIENMDCN